MIEITFLGTGASIPTKKRGMFSIHLKHLNHSLLFDCGEGTQRQMVLAGISPFKVEKIFITHLHADHVLGLAGLIQTMNFLGREKPLEVYGPDKIKKYVRFFKEWDYLEMGYDIKAKKVKEGVIVNEEDYKINAFEVKHSCPCYSYVFEEKIEPKLDKKKFKKHGLKEGPELRELKEKGRIRMEKGIVKLEDVLAPSRKPTKISIVVDTLPIEKIVEKVRDSDLLISEATHSHELKERSHEYFHMTAKDAAMIAKKANAKKLVITHFSARYDDEKVLEKEAKKVFKDTIAAKDFTVVQV